MIDLTGQRFGRLVVEGEAERRRLPRGQLRRMWRCLCDCGTVIQTQQQALNNGLTRSCGCLKRERAAALCRDRKTHGHTAGNVPYTPEYVSWQGMIRRCTNPGAGNFEYYGGRGITVCDRWRDSFEAFLADMGPRPEGMTLDRYPDPDGDYEPGNCRWATAVEQRANRRKGAYG